MRYDCEVGIVGGGPAGARFEPAQVQRRLLFRMGLARRLIRSAGGSPGVHAFLCTLLNGANGHDVPWVGDWLRSYRAARAAPVDAV